VGDEAAGRPWRRLKDSERREWAAAMAVRVTVDRVGESVSVRGPCPACDHDFSVVLTEKEILAELENGYRGTAASGTGGRVDWTGNIEVLVACHCDEGHEGRPSVIGHGCGASGWLVDDLDA
jgi:hypothetical protein